MLCNGFPGATVTVTGDAIEGERTAISDQSGYSVPNLPPGTYTVTVDLEGYQTKQYNNVVIQDQRITIKNSQLVHDLSGETGPRLTAMVSAAEVFNVPTAMSRKGKTCRSRHTP